MQNSPTISTRVPIRRMTLSDVLSPVTFPVEQEADHCNTDGEQAFESLETPRIASLSALLVQGTLSRDSDMLEKAFSINDQDLIKSSLRHLPEQNIIPLLDEIAVRLSKKPLRALQLVPWLRALFQARSTYLLTVPDLPSHLHPLYAIIETRTKTYKRLVQLGGKLDMVLGQMEENKRGPIMIDPVELQRMLTTPLAVYDESDEEEVFYEENDDDDDGVYDGKDGMEEDEEDAMSVDEEDEDDVSDYSNIERDSDKDVSDE